MGYVMQLELYAGLPRDFPSSLPSFGLEDVPCGKDFICGGDTQLVDKEATTTGQEVSSHGEKQTTEKGDVSQNEQISSRGEKQTTEKGDVSQDEQGNSSSGFPSRN